MNKQGQLGPIGTVFMFLLFLVMYFLFLGKWLSDIGQGIVTSNSLSGTEAFFYSNISMWVFIVSLLGMVGYTYFNAGQR